MLKSSQFQSFETRWKGNANLASGTNTILCLCFQETLWNKTRSNSTLLIFVVNLSNCLCAIMLLFLRNLQEKEFSFFAKGKNGVLICSIKSFLSTNSFNLELSVKVIKLIEYVNCEYRSLIVQEKAIENFADFLMSFNYSIIQPFFKHSLSLFLFFFCITLEQFCWKISHFHCFGCFVKISFCSLTEVLYIH